MSEPESITFNLSHYLPFLGFLICQVWKIRKTGELELEYFVKHRWMGLPELLSRYGRGESRNKVASMFPGYDNGEPSMFQVVEPTWIVMAL